MLQPKASSQAESSWQLVKGSGLELESVCWVPGSGFNIMLLDCVHRSISKSNSGIWGSGGGYLLPHFLLLNKGCWDQLPSFPLCISPARSFVTQNLTEMIRGCVRGGCPGKTVSSSHPRDPWASGSPLGRVHSVCCLFCEASHTLSEHLVLLKYTKFSSFKDSSIEFLQSCHF